MNSSRLRPLAAVAFAFACTPIAVQAQAPAPPASTTDSAPTTPSEKARAEIQARLDKRNSLIAKKDMAALTLYFAPDFVSITSEGRKMTLAQVRAASQKTFDTLDTVDISDTIDAITLKGNTATVDMSETQKVTVREPSGISHTVTVQIQSRCFWENGKNGWLMKRARVLQAGADMDGKPARVSTPG